MITKMPRKKRDAAMEPEAFRRLLEAAGLTTRDAAALLGVGHATVSRWGSGATPIAKSSAKLILALIKKPKK